MWRQALGLQGERWKKSAETLVFSRRKQWMLNKFWGFNENASLETSNDLDDSEISLFIEGNRNVNTTKKTKTDLNVWKRMETYLYFDSPYGLAKIRRDS